MGNGNCADGLLQLILSGEATEMDSEKEGSKGRMSLRGKGTLFSFLGFFFLMHVFSSVIEGKIIEEL